MHATASINGTTIAETDSYEVVEGNVYFPAASVKNMDDIFTKTQHGTHCPWKGDASYYTIQVDGKEYENAAWYYTEPFEKAKHIKDHVAFYKSVVKVEKD